MTVLVLLNKEALNHGQIKKMCDSNRAGLRHVVRLEPMADFEPKYCPAAAGFR